MFTIERQQWNNDTKTDKINEYNSENNDHI
jgi:hypothetical protein